MERRRCDNLRLRSIKRVVRRGADFLTARTLVKGTCPEIAGVGVGQDPSLTQFVKVLASALRGGSAGTIMGCTPPVLLALATLGLLVSVATDRNVPFRCRPTGHRCASALCRNWWVS